MLRLYGKETAGLSGTGHQGKCAAMNDHSEEVEQGRRFRFGENWQHFLRHLDEDRIEEARKSLVDMLGCSSLDGRRLLDIGSGSGLFSLAAVRLGASVHSFDYDPQSVECARVLRQRYCTDETRWTIEQGSVLDGRYLRSLGSFDVVYSWGVLHHTGAMWEALENALIPLKPGGRLYIAIYNDQGILSQFWKLVKRMYCTGKPGQILVIVTMIPGFVFVGLLMDIAALRNPLARYKNYRKARGMSVVHDWIDWLGGYPFEVARPDDVRDFFVDRRLVITELRRKTGMGCNEFVFEMPLATDESPEDGGRRVAAGS